MGVVFTALGEDALSFVEGFGVDQWQQRKQESLVDVEDVALGHQTKLTWNPQDQ